MNEKSYFHKMCGVMDMERFCNHCFWYNCIQRVEKDGTYIINCASKECTHGKDELNLIINKMIRLY